MKIYIILAVLLTACSQTKKEYIVTDIVKYENDSIYSQGNFLVEPNGDTEYTKIGRWNLYYPSGQIWSIDEYDTVGNISSYNEFYPNGKPKLHYKTDDERDEFIEYSTTGELLSIETINNPRGGRKYDKSFEQLFYPNGMVLSLNEGVNSNEKVLWINDTTGKTMLRIELERGRWIKRMHPKPPPNERDDN